MRTIRLLTRRLTPADAVTPLPAESQNALVFDLAEKAGPTTASTVAGPWALRINFVRAEGAVSRMRDGIKRPVGEGEVDPPERERNEPAVVKYRESVDFERVDALIAWAEVEDGKRKAGLPSEWDQGDWTRVDRRLACGTACCIAGKVALDDGVLDDGVLLGSLRVSVRVIGGRSDIPDYAQAVLGLPGGGYFGPTLFAGSNTLADLKRIRDEYAVAEGVPTRYEVAS